MLKVMVKSLLGMHIVRVKRVNDLPRRPDIQNWAARYTHHLAPGLKAHCAATHDNDTHINVSTQFGAGLRRL